MIPTTCGECDEYWEDDCGNGEGCCIEGHCELDKDLYIYTGGGEAPPKGCPIREEVEL